MILLSGLYSIVGVILFIFIIKLNTNYLYKPYLLNIFMYFYVLLTFPGIIFYLIVYYEKMPLNILYTILLLSTSYYLFSISFIVGLFLKKRNFLFNFKLKLSFLKLLIITLITIPFAFYFFISTEGYKAILSAFEGDMITAYYYRTHATNALANHAFLMTAPFKIVYPVLGMIFFGFYLKYSKTKYLVLFVFSSLFILFYNIALIQKYYLVQYIFMLGLMYMIIKEKMNFNFQIKLFLLIFSVLIGLVLIFVGSTGIDFQRTISIIANISDRIFVSNIESLSKYIQAYIDGFPLLYGKSLSNPGHLFNYQPFPLTKWISENYIMTKAQIEAGIVGSSPSNYIGEIILNFGFLGFIFITLFLGIVIVFIHHVTKFTIDSKDKNPLSLTIMIFLAINIANISKGSIGDFFSYLTFLAMPNWIIIILVLSSSSIILRNVKT